MNTILAIGQGGRNVSLIVIGPLLLIFLLCFQIWMLVNAIRNPIRNKALWILGILLFPLIGSLLYYFIGRKNFTTAASSYQSAPTSSGRKTILTIVSLILFIFGAGFLALGSFTYYTDQYVPSSYVNTTATITQVKQIYHAPSQCGTASGCLPANYTYHAIVSFNVQNQTYQFTSNYGGTPFQGASPAVGKSVTVAYNPNDPNSKPRDTSNKLNYGYGQVFIIIGSVLAIAGILLFILARKKSHKSIT